MTNEERDLISSLIVSTCREMFDTVSDGPPIGLEPGGEMHLELRGSESPLLGPQRRPALAAGSAVLF